MVAASLHRSFLAEYSEVFYSPQMQRCKRPSRSWAVAQGAVHCRCSGRLRLFEVVNATSLHPVKQHALHSRVHDQQVTSLLSTGLDCRGRTGSCAPRSCAAGSCALLAGLGAPGCKGRYLRGRGAWVSSILCPRRIRVRGLAKIRAFVSSMVT